MIELIIQGLAAALVATIAIKSFVKSYSKPKYENFYFPVIFIGILNIILVSFSFLWFFKIINYTLSDLLVMYCFLVTLQTFSFFGIIYFSLPGNKMLLLLSSYVLVIFSFVFHFSPIYLVVGISLLVFLVLSLRLSSEVGHKKTGYAGILYSSVSLLSLVFIFFRPFLVKFLVPLSTLFFLFFIYILTKQIKGNPLNLKKRVEDKKESSILHFIKYFIFIIVITNFIFIGTIGIHEFGHLGVSKFYDCNYRKIVYEEGVPHTEVLCGDLTNNLWVILGGVLSPILVAAILFLIGGRLIKDLSFLVLGFNLMASYQDIIDLNISQNLSIFVVALGLTFVIIGIALLARTRVEKEFYPF